MPVILDVESRSRADLKKVGGRKYWEHPSSEVLCVVCYDTRTSQVFVWDMKSPWPFEGRTLVAHNANGFDRFALEKLGVIGATWEDSSCLARVLGLAGSLEALEAFTGVPKDKVASRYTTSLSSAKRPGHISAKDWGGLSTSQKKLLGDLPEVDQDKVLNYCATDVYALSAAWGYLSGARAIDAPARWLDQKINDRGIRFDHDLAKILLKHDEENSKRVVAEAALALGMTQEACANAARSHQQFCQITGSENAQKSLVETMDHPLAKARLALASVNKGKLEAGLARVHSDGRLRDILWYHGAVTGRWSGKGMQLQNLPRPSKRFDEVDVDRFASEVILGQRVCDDEEISFLIRATLWGLPLVGADASAIEARALSWAASDEKSLNGFRSGLDSYKVAASGMFGVPYDNVEPGQRQVGKVAELACQYGGGVAAFESFAANFRLDLSGLDTKQVVSAWRKSRPCVTRLWNDMEAAWKRACEGNSGIAGAFEFTPFVGMGAIACWLPSGRPIVYQQASAEMTYQAPKEQAHVWGGKLVENAIQALCRDLLVHFWYLAETNDMNPVLTVHDEIICETKREDALSTLIQMMTDVPEWADGFPMGASGWQGIRYRKG